jgi:hypothetical protein
VSTWEERMAAKHRAKVDAEVEAARRAYLGEVFLRFYPPHTGVFEPMVEILPEVIAANCLGIAYGDPGPRLEGKWCRQCWGDRHVWLGNAWGLQHTGGLGLGECKHGCHEGEAWLADGFHARVSLRG